MRTNQRKYYKQQLTFIKYLTIITLSVAAGYSWAASAYLPQIKELKTTIQHLDDEITTFAFNTYLNIQ